MIFSIVVEVIKSNEYFKSSVVEILYGLIRLLELVQYKLICGHYVVIFCKWNLYSTGTTWQRLRIRTNIILYEENNFFYQ